MSKVKESKLSGGVSGLILGLGGLVVIIILAFLVVNKTQLFVSPPPLPTEEETTEPAYEVVAGDIKFALYGFKDQGNFLRASQTKSSRQVRKDLTTAEKFIEVTISAENIGKDNIKGGSWEIKELVDSEGRKFYSPRETEPWVSEESQCGAVLKPGFSPTLCTNIYEVAKISSGLKVRVYSKEQPREDFFIDLGI